MTTVDSKTDQFDRRSPETSQRAAWETPRLVAVGTVAELVQVPKFSGTQDCGASKRQNDQNTGTCPL